MILDPASLDRRQSYGLLISILVPRPVAWVSTCDAAGRTNLAPFSFFMGVSSDPPTLAVAVGTRRGRRKDTSANAIATGEFVVNVVDEALAASMVATSAEYPPEVSEFEAEGIAPAPSQVVRPPRVADSPVSMECRLLQHHEIGRSATDLLIGEIVLFHIRDGLLDEAGNVDVTRLRPLGRLGGELYAPIREILRIPRPRS